MKTAMNVRIRRFFSGRLYGWVELPAIVLALIVAGVFPLFFHDQFFDINRTKLALLQNSTRACAIGCGALFLLDHAVHKSLKRIRFSRPTLADIGMTMFFLSAGLSAYFSAYGKDAMTGEAGRGSGFVFILSLYLMYLSLSRALHMRPFILCIYFIAGVAAATLGVLNFYMIDPLGFYQNMKESQTIIFISTIGNINFFGIYLCMVLAVALALFMHVQKRSAQVLCAICVFICFYGTIAARSDGAILGVLLLFLMLFYYGLATPRRFARVSTLFLLYAVSLLFVRIVGLISGWYGYAFQGGLCEAIIKSNIPAYLTLLGMLLVLCGVTMIKNDVTMPTPRLRRFMLAGIGILAAIALALVVYFTLVDPYKDAGALTQFLRFDDAWGTYRGFVWTRSLEAYGQLGSLQKIVGTGPDTMRYVLEPYRDLEIEAAANGVFENCHNEYLQYLVTTGALGLAGYLLLLVGSIRDAYLMRHSWMGLSLLLMLCVYAPLALINVNQPVSVVQFFLAASLTASLRRGGVKKRPLEREGDAHESGSVA